MGEQTKELNGPSRKQLITGVLQFIHRLREAAIPVSMVEALDAMQSIKHIDLSDRSQFKSALATTLVKRDEQLPVFESLFEIYFAPRRVRGEATPAGPEERGEFEATVPAEGEPVPSPDEEGASDRFLQQLLDALREGDEEAVRALAAAAVEEFGGIDDQHSASERYYVYRILRQLDLQQLLQRAIREKLDEEGVLSALEERLLRDERIRSMEEFRRRLAEEIRRRLAQVRGASEAAGAIHERPIEDVDFLAASPTELRHIREAIRPLAQKMASRIAHRRRFRRHGRLDVRRTVRRSLSSGGVPLDPSFRYPRASKPDLYLLCDISGSVAEFAHFTISLLHAMKKEFSKIRLFVFVDGVDEVTEVFEEHAEWLAPRNLLHRADVIWADGHSDYGNVFDRFWRLYGQDGIDGRATVIVTGDARNNYRDPGLPVLKTIHERARKVYWLNPEPRVEWDTSDSIMDVYTPECDGVFEVRNLRQLADFVYQIV